MGSHALPEPEALNVRLIGICVPVQEADMSSFRAREDAMGPVDNYGFTFTSVEKVPLHTYMTFPLSSNTEACVDALPPRTDQHHHFTTYSDACWGFQIGNAIHEGIQPPLFKFHSMSGAIISILAVPLLGKWIAMIVPH